MNVSHYGDRRLVAAVVARELSMSRAPNDRVTISYRCPERLRKRIEEAAAEDGLNLTQEITKCIEFCLDEDKRSVYKSPLIRMIALAKEQIELTAGQSWLDNEVAAQKFRNSIIAIVDMLYPPKVLSNALATTGNETFDAARLALEVAEEFKGKELETILDRALHTSERLRELVTQMTADRGV